MAVERYLVKDYHYEGVDYPVGLRSVPEKLSKLIDIDMEANKPQLITVEERTFDTSKVDPNVIIEASMQGNTPALEEIETPVVKSSVKRVREQKAAEEQSDGGTGQV